MVNVIVPPVLRGKKISFVQTSKLLWRLYSKFLGNWTKRRPNSWFLRISLDPTVPPTPLWCHQWSWSARWCLVAKFTQIHLSIFFRRWRGTGLSGGLQRTRVLVDSFRLSLGGLILCSVQFVYRTSGNDAVHEAGLNWSNSIRVSKILSNLIKLLYITNFTKSKNP